MSVYLPKSKSGEIKSPYYAYDFQAKGKRYHGSTGETTLRKAEAVERRIRSEVAQGTFGDGAEMTWDEAAGRWWMEVGRHRASARQLQHRLAIALRLIGPRTRLHETTTRKISAAIEKRRGEQYARAHDRAATDDAPAKRAARYDLKNATVNADVVKPLQRVMNRARKVWEIKNLPEVDWCSLTLPEPETEIRIYTEAQQTAWLDACGPTERFALRLLLTYGLRFGELFCPLDALIPDAPGGPVLVVNKRKRSALYMPLVQADARMLAARLGRAREAGLDTFWFERVPGRDAKGRQKLAAITYSALQSRLRQAAKRAGLTLPRLIHGTRHHVGTTILAESGDLKLAQQALGHADIKSTLRYAHALTGKLRAAMDSRNNPGAPDADAEFSVPIQTRVRKRP